jgi:predicted Zn-dependent protease with MMP-like domain
MISNEQFDAVVDAALRSIPDELWAEVDNLEVFVEDQAPGEPHLYGLYTGVPRTERTVFSPGEGPGGVTIYRQPLIRDYGSRPERLQEQIRITVLHEIGHYFGMSEERLRELGYG